MIERLRGAGGDERRELDVRIAAGGDVAHDGRDAPSVEAVAVDFAAHFAERLTGGAWLMPTGSPSFTPSMSQAPSESPASSSPTMSDVT